MARQNATTSFIPEQEDKYCIYIHKNKINGKVYVGQTKQKPEYRWNHGKGYIKNIDFYTDIELYGWEEGFIHVIIEKNLSSSEVDEREQYWVRFYDSYNNGYNQNEGGHAPHNYNEKTREHFKEIRQQFWDSEKGQIAKEKISQTLKEFYSSPEGIEKRKELSSKKKGENNPHYGLKHSEENIQKMRDCKKGELNPNYNKKGIKNHLSKPIYCLELNKFFGSGQEAQRETGADASSISRCCKGKANVAKGMHWRYATEEEVIKLKEELL